MADRRPAEPSPISPVVPFPEHPAQRRAGLTAPLTSLVGREREVAAVWALLASDDVRLVTLTGPGGVGKTRLALRVGETVGARFADGVVFVGLAHVRDPGRVLPTIARALDVREAGGRAPDELLRGVLHGRRLLLVLDNLEQVPDAGPRLAELLVAVPGPKILATSRALLRVSGEHGFPVPPLSLSAAAGGPDAAATEGSEAVRLFVARARALRPDFALDEGSAPVVADICRRVDGLPLGIELAAARLRHLSPAALLALLNRRLPLLTDGPRDAPDRLRTMRDAIAWSHDLLSAAEQTLFRRLAVFVGGFTLEAAERVCRDDAEDDRSLAPLPASIPLLGPVASLVDKSFLRAEETTPGEMRYEMLETIREFGLERLAESGEEEAIRDRHARWCRQRAARTLAFPLRGTVRPRELDRLDAELGNLRAALTRHAARDEAAALLELATVLTHFWSLRGYRAEGRRWLERGLAMADGAELPLALHAAGYHAAAALARTQHDQARAVDLANEALARFRTLGDARGIAGVTQLLGLLERGRGDLDRAALLHGEALARFRELGEPFWVALASYDLGILAYWRSDHRRGMALLAEAVGGFRALDDPWGEGIALGGLALATGDGGALDQAAALHRASLARLRQVGSKESLVDAVARIATLAMANGRAAVAARLLGAAEALGEGLGYVLEGPEQARYARAAAAARAALGDDALATAWEAGRALSLPAAVAEADAALAEPAASSPGGLTPREAQILRLLATGASNRQIGERLFISPATVARHVANLYAKLGVASRAEATAFAHRHGLA